MKWFVNLVLLSACTTSAWADTGPVPKDVIKSRQEGTVPTAVWLAECETLFADFLGARRALDDLIEAGGYENDPAALTRAVNRETVPAAQAVLEFSTTYVPDSKWGQQLRLDVIDAMVSSLASDSHIVEVVEGKAESEVPLDEMLQEQKEMSTNLISEVNQRFRDAPEKYRGEPEELLPSREYYFQNFTFRIRKGK